MSQRLSQARSLLTALLSWLRYGDATLFTYQLRQGLCLGVPNKTLPCNHLQQTKTGIFCGACGCPQWGLSDLRSKWRMPAVECPVHKW